MKRALLAVGVAAPIVLLGFLVSRPGLDEWSGARARAAVALLALLWARLLRARRREGRPVRPVIAQGLTLAVALVAAAVWFDFGAVPATGGVHRHDVFHYYLGGKYPRELGYGLLYRCTAVAEAEDGREAEVRRRQMRDLETLRLVPAAGALADPAACRARFSDARWRAFREDVQNLRAGVSDAAWEETQTDFGYNPSPAWSATSALLPRLVPSTGLGLRCLSAIDFALFLGCIAMLHAAFGLRVAALAWVLWGTQEPAKLTWIAFTMLRLDWLFLLVAALALLRRGRPALAGAALGWSAAMRVFPALGLAGVLLSGIAWPLLRARFAAGRRRFALGFAGAALGTAVLGAAVAGPASWLEWAQHIRHHAATTSSNNIGLGVVLSFDRAHRVERMQERLPGATKEEWTRRWSEEVRATREARRVPLRALQLAYGGLLLLALVRARRPWIGLTLSILAVPALIDVSGYYLMYFMIAATLASARASLERTLLGFAAAVQVAMVMPAVAWFFDDRYLALSVAYVGVAALLTFAFARRRFTPAP